jgi:galactokinase
MSDDFADIFGAPATVQAFAPGRVNLIGDHTDYQSGFVLPVALTVGTSVALRPRRDDLVRVYSANQPTDGVRSFSLSDGGAQGHEGWTAYVRAVGAALLAAGYSIRGFDAQVRSGLPLGGGLSSSASLQVALLRALRSAFALPIDDGEIATLAHTAESRFVGVPVGMLDQLACSLGDPAHALFIDMRSMQTERVPLPDDVTVIVIGSGIAHRHSDGGYRTRRAEAEEAARRLGVGVLRELGPADLDRVEALPDPLRRRARHIVTENQRVLAFREALAAGSPERLGRIMEESHRSLRDDYEVSLREIDLLVQIAVGTPGVHGARLTGGGFGGAVVALAAAAVAAGAARSIATEYAARAVRPMSSLLTIVNKPGSGGETDRIVR